MNGERDMSKCVIQVQHMSESGFPLGGWQDYTHLNSPTSQTVVNQMVQARNAFRRVRVRAVDGAGRMIDMMAYVG
jgi:hypothetical protein